MEDCKVTWEKEDTIPKNIVEEYESQVLVDVQQLTTENMSNTLHTLYVTTREKNSELDPKRQKTDRITVSSDNGLVAINKLRICINHYTATLLCKLLLAGQHDLT